MTDKDAVNEAIVRLAEICSPTEIITIIGSGFSPEDEKDYPLVVNERTVIHGCTVWRARHD